jgi:hypothetical protein
LQLEEKIKEKVNDKFKGKVALQSERDLFMRCAVQWPDLSISSLIFPSVISVAINVQLRELESAYEGAFNAMSRVNWGAISQVTGHSPFIDDIIQVTEQVTEVIKPLVEQKKYLRNFFDKACRCVLKPVNQHV